MSFLRQLFARLLGYHCQGVDVLGAVASSVKARPSAVAKRVEPARTVEQKQPAPVEKKNHQAMLARVSQSTQEQPKEQPREKPKASLPPPPPPKKEEPQKTLHQRAGTGQQQDKESAAKHAQAIAKAPAAISKAASSGARAMASGKKLLAKAGKGKGAKAAAAIAAAKKAIASGQAALSAGNKLKGLSATTVHGLILGAFDWKSRSFGGGSKSDSHDGGSSKSGGMGGPKTSQQTGGKLTENIDAIRAAIDYAYDVANNADQDADEADRLFNEYIDQPKNLNDAIAAAKKAGADAVNAGNRATLSGNAARSKGAVDEGTAALNAGSAAIAAGKKAQGVPGTGDPETLASEATAATEAANAAADAADAATGKQPDNAPGDMAPPSDGGGSGGGGGSSGGGGGGDSGGGGDVPSQDEGDFQEAAQDYSQRPRPEIEESGEPDWGEDRGDEESDIEQEAAADRGADDEEFNEHADTMDARRQYVDDQLDSQG